MTTLAGFLLARYAEEQVTAEEILQYLDEHQVIEVMLSKPTGVNVRQTKTITLPRPEQTLKDLESKRRIVEHLGHHAYWDDNSLGDQARATLELLALPYADHPDFQSKWQLWP